MSDRIYVGLLLTAVVLMFWGLWKLTEIEPLPADQRPVPCHRGTCWERQ